MCSIRLRGARGLPIQLPYYKGPKRVVLERLQPRHVLRSVGDIFCSGRSLADENCFPRIIKIRDSRNAFDLEFDDAEFRVF